MEQFSAESQAVVSTEIKLLGPLQIRRNGNKASVGPKAAALLALLGVERTCSRERLLGLLWPDSPQKKAQGSLRYLLHSLGKSQPDLVHSDATSVNLAPEVLVDIEHLRMASRPEQRAAAAQLRHGLFCEGLSSGSAEFDDWLSQQRERWAQAVVANLLELSSQLPSAEGLKPARQAVALDPANEKAHATLISLLMSLGEVAEANRQMERCRECLREELGVEPSASTLALLEEPPAGRAGHNLSHISQRLVGREEATQRVVGLLRDHRLVTVTGEGGIGKTSLSVQVGHSLELPRDGIWLLELARLRDPGHLEAEVARVCGIKPGTPLLDALKSRELLLILDNCEHLVEACAHLVEQLLGRCPGVKVLATSREALAIVGEHIVILDPLSTPPQGHSDPRQFPAVKLFLERVRQSGIEPPGELQTVAEICRRLDGLPLAIELAASRVKALTAEQILQRLNQRFQLLRGGRRTADLRQRTLHDLIDWSYSLLDTEQAKLLRSVSIFRGGFYLEAAASILQADLWEVSDRLEQLVEKSLLRTQAAGEGLRYRLLESIQQFAWQKLEQTQELGNTRDRHLAYFIGLAHKLCPLTRGDQQRLWLDRLDSELANFRAGLGWAMGKDPNDALELAAALCPLWKDRDHREEGRSWLEKALTVTDSSHPEWARAILLRAEIELQQGHREQALESLNCALQLARDQERPDLLWRTLKGLGSTLFFLERYQESLTHYREARTGFKKLGDAHEVANCTNNLGLVELYQGHLEEARTLFTEGRDFYQQMGDLRGAGIAIGNLATVALEERSHQVALGLFLESLTALERVGALWNSAYFLEGLGKVLAELKRSQEAVQAFSVAQRLRDQLETPRLGGEVGSYQKTTTALKTQLGEQFQQVWAQARPWKPKQLLARIRP